MDDHKTVSVSRVYVPNEYLLYLSPRDREQFRGYEGSLLEELAAYLTEHARREGYALLSAPRVTLHEDADLAVGEFGIATRMVQPQPMEPLPAPAPPPLPPVVVPPPPPPAEPAEPPAAPAASTAVASAAAQAEPGGTRVYEKEELAAPAQAAAAAEAHPVVVVAGVRHELGRGTLTLGRATECDIVVDDLSTSRRHAELRSEDGDYWVVDLGSTNGTEVNGKRVDRAKLEPGDVITVGQTQLHFERVV
jgi:hypothetical protein